MNIINRSLTDSSINIFYIGVDNAIELDGVKNIPEFKVTVKGAGSRISHREDKKYIVQVQSVSDTCLLVVYNKNGKKVFERNYKTRSISSAVLLFAGQTDTTITIGRIPANPCLKIVFPGCYLRMNYKIVSFDATFVHDTSSISTEQRGDVLSTEQVRFVKTLRSGDTIFFDQIYAVGPDSKRQHLPSFWIKIE